MKKREIQEIINKTIEESLDKKFKSILEDISYRIESLYASGINVINGGNDDRYSKVTSMDLSLAKHMLDGYVITDNSPSAGYVAWTDCKIVYKGITYTIQNGNSNTKYIWWQFSATDKTLFQMTNTKPTLTEDDVLVFVNDGGKHTTVLGQMATGSAILDGTVGTSVIANSAIQTSKLATGAVDSTILASGAVTSTAIASGAVGTGQLATGSVTATQIADGTITSSEIGAGAIATDRLNVATHMIF